MIFCALHYLCEVKFKFHAYGHQLPPHFNPLIMEVYMFMQVHSLNFTVMEHRLFILRD